VKVARAALVLALAAPAAAAEMYKCVDARGVTHYADKPTPGCQNTALDIQASPPLSGALAPPAESTAQQEADFRRRRLERDEAESAEQAERTQSERRCATLRAERAVLSSGRRIAQIDATGERVYMDDAVRDQRLAELQAALAQCR
jgi:Domain of unknown function (DUF4124)